jgi:hypothetical protein
VNTEPEFFILDVSSMSTSDTVISMKLDMTMTASKKLNQCPLKYYLKPIASSLSTISAAKIPANRRFNFSTTLLRP